MAGKLSALDYIKANVSMKPQKRVIPLENGASLDMYLTPSTLKERNNAKKRAGSNEVNDWALVLLIQKATDEHGNRMFEDGQGPELINDIPFSVLDRMMYEVLTEQEVPEQGFTLKSVDEAA